MENETFKLVKYLGGGAFAQTWMATVLDTNLAKKWGMNEVAIKIPLDPDKEKALIDEIHLNGALYMRLTEIESKNIIKYISFDKFNNKIVMVMEYAKGGSLRGMIGKVGDIKVMETNKALQIIQGVLEGLSVIHKNYIIHRDIKPENILMIDGIPKVSDLSIGRFLKPNEIASTTTGTICYMSPEILHADYEGSHATYNSDIWSVGITLYEMLAGKYPFGIYKEMPFGDIVRVVADKNVELEFSESDKISARLKRIISKSLRRNPNERYASADEMLKDLNKLSRADEEELEKAIKDIRQLFNDSQNEEAVEIHFKEIIKKFPDSSRIYLNIGEYFNKRSRYDKAIASFEKGIEIDNGNAVLHWGLAMAHLMKEDNELALKSIQNALDCGLESTMERYARGLAETLKKKL